MFTTISEDEWNRMGPDDDTKERFWSHVYRWGDRCWLWAGSIDTRYHIKEGTKRYDFRDGDQGRLRGVFSYRGKTVSAHIMAYILEKGPIPEGYDIHHICKEPICVRPEHLIALSPETHRLVESILGCKAYLERIVRDGAGGKYHGILVNSERRRLERLTNKARLLIEDEATRQLLDI